MKKYNNFLKILFCFILGSLVLTGAGLASAYIYNPTTGGGGGAGNPSVPFTGIQYNNSGSFGADADHTIDPSTGNTTLKKTLTNEPGVTGLYSGSDFPGFPITGIPGSGSYYKMDNGDFLVNGDFDLSAIGGSGTYGSVNGLINFTSNNQAITLAEPDGLGGYQYTASTQNGTGGEISTNLELLNGQAFVQAVDGNNNTYSGLLSQVNDADPNKNLAALQNQDIYGNVNSIYVNNAGIHIGQGTSTFNFPTTDGTSGQVLTTDGSGNWTFQNAPGGAGLIGWTEGYYSNGNASFGYYALGNTTPGGPGYDGSYANTALGGQSLYSLGTDSGLGGAYSRNTAVGFAAMPGVVEGYSNVAVGYQSMNGSVDNTHQVYQNVFIGSDSTIDGSGDTVNGVYIGNGIITSEGTGTVAIGQGISVGAGVSNSVCLGQGADCSFSNTFSLKDTINQTRIAGINYGWPGAQGAQGSILTNDGSGNLGWNLPDSTVPSNVNLINQGIAVGSIVVTNVTVPATTTTYQVGGYMNINSISGGADLKYEITYTDENNVGKAVDIIPSETTTGDYSATPTIIRCLAGSAIGVFVINGTGTANVDVGAVITKYN